MLPEVQFGDSAIFMFKTHIALFFFWFVYGNVLHLHFLE